MKRLIFFLSTLLILGSFFLDRGGVAWPVERSIVNFLVHITGRSFPSLTAIKCSLSKEQLAAQDLALILRAIIHFHPRCILVAEPLGDLSSGPLTLVKEALATGALEDVPLIFAALPSSGKQILWAPADVAIIPETTILPKIIGKVAPVSSWGFIASSEQQELVPLPLFARDSNDALIASFWWKCLVALSQEKNSHPLFYLLANRFLLSLPNNGVLFLDDQARVRLSRRSSESVLSLEDLLLHREEMERGEIAPEMDRLFRHQNVLVGGPHVSQQAACLEDAEVQLALRRLSPSLYGALLLILTWGVIFVSRFALLDLLLCLVCFLLFYAGLGTFLFHAFGILLPLFLPTAIVLTLFLRRRFSNF